MYLGDFPVGSTIYIPFNTYSSDDPAASMTITGLAVTDIEIYKNGSTTQRASDAGYTLLDTDGIDFDTITGIHGFSIDTSDDTTGGFFVAGADYWVVVSSITLDAGTISFVVSFSIENRHVSGKLVSTTIATLASQTSFTLTVGSADNDAYNNCAIIVSDKASAIQKAFGYISDYTGATKTVTLAADPGIFTMAAGDNVSVLVMRGTDSAYTGTPPTVAQIQAEMEENGASILDTLQDRLTDARAAVLSDWINGGRLDNLLDAIPTTAMRGTDNAALASVLGAAVGASISADIAANLTAINGLNDLSAQQVWEYVIENSKTAQDYMIVLKAVAAGKSSGGGTATITYRNDADSANVAVGTVAAVGNRTAVTLTP